MKTRKIILAGLLMATAIFQSCKEKKTDVITPVNNAKETIKEFFEQNGSQRQSFTINVDNGVATIVGDSGTIVKIPEDAFVTASGQPVSGNVTITLVEILDKADMVLSNMPTVSNGQVLVSGGQIFIGATANGQELQLADSTTILISLPKETNEPDMTLFTGSVTDSGTVNWEQVPDVVVSQNRDSVAWLADYNNVYYQDAQRYIYAVSTLGWINCDKFYNEPTTSMTVVCNNVEGVATQGFIVFKNLNSIMGIHQYPIGIYPVRNIPLNEPISIIIIAKKGDQEYIAVKDVTVTADAQLSIELTPKTEQEIQNIVNQKCN